VVGPLSDRVDSVAERPPAKLANVDLAVFSKLSGSRITQVRIVLPNNRLCAFPVTVKK
jgi:hypothetical protein